MWNLKFKLRMQRYDIKFETQVTSALIQNRSKKNKLLHD